MSVVLLRDNIFQLASECFHKPSLEVANNSCIFCLETKKNFQFMIPVEKPLLQDNMDMLLAVLQMDFKDKEIRNVFMRSVLFNAMKGFSASMFMKSMLPPSITRQALEERGEFVKLGFAEALPLKTEHKGRNFNFSKQVVDYVPTALNSMNDILSLDGLLKSSHQLVSVVDIAYLVSYFRKPEWERLGDDVWWELMACLVCPEVNSQVLFDFYLTNPNVPDCIVLNLKPGTYIVPQGEFRNRGIMGPAEGAADSDEAVLVLNRPLVLHASCQLWNLRICPGFPFDDAETGLVVRCVGRQQSEKHSAVVANVVLDRGGIMFQYLRSARLVNSIVQRTPVGVFASNVTELRVTRVNSSWGSCMSNFWECGVAFVAQNCLSILFEKQIVRSCASIFRVSDTLEFTGNMVMAQEIGLLGHVYARDTVTLASSQVVGTDCTLRVRSGGQLRQNYVLTLRKPGYPVESMPFIAPLQDWDLGKPDLGFTFSRAAQSVNEVFAPEDVARWMQARRSTMEQQSVYAKRRPNPSGDPPATCYHAVRNEMYAGDFAGTPYTRGSALQEQEPAVGQKRPAQGEPEVEEHIRDLSELAAEGDQAAAAELNHLLNV